MLYWYGPQLGLGHKKIYLECYGGIEKSVLRIIVWHNKPCRLMANGDRTGSIFLFHPHTNNGFFFLHTTKRAFYIHVQQTMLKQQQNHHIRKESSPGHRGVLMHFNGKTLALDSAVIKSAGIVPISKNYR